MVDRAGTRIMYLAMVVGTLISISILAREFKPISITAMAWSSSNGDHGVIEMLPFSRFSKADEYADIHYSFTVQAKHQSQLLLSIVPDDRVNSIKVNGVPLTLNSVEPSLLSDYRRGFSIFLPRDLGTQPILLEVNTTNIGGAYGIALRLKEIRGKALLYGAVSFLLGVFAYLAFQLLSRIGFSPAASGAILAGSIERFAYLLVTDVGERGHDLGWHLSYVKQLLAFENKGIFDHWIVHPPTYYIIGGGFVRVLEWFGIYSESNFTFILQLFSFSCSIGTLILTIATVEFLINHVCREGQAIKADQGRLRFWSLLCWQLLVYLLAACWPSYVLHSPRVGNESLAYLFFALAFYKIVLWFYEQKRGALKMALAYTFLASITKSFGFILFGVVAGCYVAHFFLIRSERRIAPIVSFMLVLSTLFLMAATIVYVPPYLDKQSGNRENLIIPDADYVSAGLRVGNRAQNYLWFDLKMFINSPFASPWEDNSGRQFFANYLGKTALFGEFSFSSQILQDLAVCISWVATLLFAFTMFRMVGLTGQELIRYFPCWLGGALLVAAIVLIRIVCPVNVDFRYIAQSQPIILFSLWYSGECLHRNGKFRSFMYMTLLLAAGIISSVMFVGTLVRSEWG